MYNPNSLAFKRGPRARACDTCRRWKKRCDQLKPACTRCSDSGSECTYSYVKVYYQYEAQTATLRQEASRRHGYLINLPTPRRNSTNHIPDHHHHQHQMHYHYNDQLDDERMTKLRDIGDEPHPMYQQRNPQSLPSLSSLSLLPNPPRRSRPGPDNTKLFEPYSYDCYSNPSLPLSSSSGSSGPSPASLNFPSSVLFSGPETASSSQYSPITLPPLPTCGPSSSPLNGHFI